MTSLASIWAHHGLPQFFGGFHPQGEAKWVTACELLTTAAPIQCMDFPSKSLEVVFPPPRLCPDRGIAGGLLDSSFLLSAALRCLHCSLPVCYRFPCVASSRTAHQYERSEVTYTSIFEANCAFAAIRCPFAAPLGWAMSRRTLCTNLCDHDRYHHHHHHRYHGCHHSSSPAPL